MSRSNLADTYISLRGALARVVRGIVPPKEIEDIVQETYVRACQAERVNEIRTPRSFLYRTARNLAIDYAKRAETRLTVDDELTEDTWPGQDDLRDETLQQVCSDEEFVLFCDAVRLLPTECRRTFVLKKVYGYTQREIAEELGLSQSTVEKHVAQGVKRCTYFMEQRTQEDQSPHVSTKQNKSTAVESTNSGGRQ